MCGETLEGLAAARVVGEISPPTLLDGIQTVSRIYSAVDGRCNSRGAFVHFRIHRRQLVRPRASNFAATSNTRRETDVALVGG